MRMYRKTVKDSLPTSCPPLALMIELMQKRRIVATPLASAWRSLSAKINAWREGSQLQQELLEVARAEDLVMVLRPTGTTQVTMIRDDDDRGSLGSLSTLNCGIYYNIVVGLRTGSITVQRPSSHARSNGWDVKGTEKALS
jgi:hypothetical protein